MEHLRKRISSELKLNWHSSGKEWYTCSTGYTTRAVKRVAKRIGNLIYSSRHDMPCSLFSAVVPLNGTMTVFFRCQM